MAAVPCVPRGALGMAGRSSASGGMRGAVRGRRVRVSEGCHSRRRFDWRQGSRCARVRFRRVSGPVEALTFWFVTFFFNFHVRSFAGAPVFAFFGSGRDGAVLSREWAVRVWRLRRRGAPEGCVVGYRLVCRWGLAPFLFVRGLVSPGGGSFSVVGVALARRRSLCGGSLSFAGGLAGLSRCCWSAGSLF